MTRLALLVAFGAAFVSAAVAADDVRVTFYGGAGAVGGSCALVQEGDTRFLVDCGTFYGDEVGPDKRSSSELNGQFGFEPGCVSDVVLTHAHQDHMGRVAELVRRGFRGTVWTTPDTHALLKVLWPLQAVYEDTRRDWAWSKNAKARAGKEFITVHWRAECKWRRSIAARNLRSFTGSYAGLLAANPKYAVRGCKTCGHLDANEALAHVREVPYASPFHIGAFAIEFQNVHHIPGSAAVYVTSGDFKGLFSGDLGTVKSHMVKDIKPAEKVDAVFVETTYGDDMGKSPAELEAEYGRFRAGIGDSIKADRVVWIPAFALDRSQRVLLEIARGMRDGTIPRDTKIYYTSPSSRQLTELYVAHPDWFGAAADGYSAAALADIYGRTERAVKGLEATRYILITSSGMMDAGMSESLIPRLAPRKDVDILFVGYQAAGTYGRRIRDGEKKIKMKDGTSVKVNARPVRFDCFSGHGNADEIDRWLGNNLRSRIFLIHGDPESLVARKAGLEKRFHADVTIAELQKTYSFSVGETTPQDESRKPRQ